MVKEDLKIASKPCGHKEHRIPIDKKLAKGHAKITDIKEAYNLMKELRDYTGWVEFTFDSSNNSLDVHFKRSDMEWDYGAGIQINGLNNKDKDALKKYLKSGK